MVAQGRPGHHKKHTSKRIVALIVGFVQGFVQRFCPAPPAPDFWANCRSNIAAVPKKQASFTSSSAGGGPTVGGVWGPGYRLGFFLVKNGTAGFFGKKRGRGWGLVRVGAKWGFLVKKNGAWGFLGRISADWGVVWLKMGRGGFW